MHVRPAEPKRGLFGKLFHASAGGEDGEVVATPVLSRLSPEDQVIVQAAAFFNGSSHRRTVEGLIRSLGMPRGAIKPVGPGEAVITICWDISWYQYRVDADARQAVHLIERGFDLGDLEVAQTEWNAEVDAAGRLVPAVVPE